MSDETEGWEVGYTGDFGKEIGSHSFRIVEHGSAFYLRMPGYTLATRPTLRECQILAHQTARLWAGETE